MHVSDKSIRPRRAAASSETAREINRDILLHAIHLHQPVSRADLARLTGLQPSTVSVIIGQLIDEGWVLAGSLGRLPRGRRPTFVTLNDRHVTLAIDLRPGKANLAVVDINGKILGRETVACELHAGSAAEEARTAIAHIAQAARSLRAAYGDHVFQGLGVSVSGRVDQKTHRLLFSPNAPWTPDRSARGVAEGSGSSHRDGERGQRVLVLGALVRELQRRIEHARGVGFGGHWRGDAGGWARRARQRRHGGRVRPYAAGGIRPSVRLRQRGLLGDIRLESRRAPLLPRAGAGKHPHFISGVARSRPQGRHPRAALD